MHSKHTTCPFANYNSSNDFPMRIPLYLFCFSFTSKDMHISIGIDDDDGTRRSICMIAVFSLLLRFAFKKFTASILTIILLDTVSRLIFIAIIVLKT